MNEPTGTDTSSGLTDPKVEFLNRELAQLRLGVEHSMMLVIKYLLLIAVLLTVGVGLLAV